MNGSALEHKNFPGTGILSPKSLVMVSVHCTFVITVTLAAYKKFGIILLFIVPHPAITA
jgi:hypothetical protein